MSGEKQFQRGPNRKAKDRYLAWAKRTGQGHYSSDLRAGRPMPEYVLKYGKGYKPYASQLGGEKDGSEDSRSVSGDSSDRGADDAGRDVYGQQ